MSFLDEYVEKYYFLLIRITPQSTQDKKKQYFIETTSMKYFFCNYKIILFKTLLQEKDDAHTHTHTHTRIPEYVYFHALTISIFVRKSDVDIWRLGIVLLTKIYGN